MQIADKKYSVTSIKPDGNCLFSACSTWLNLNKEMLKSKQPSIAIPANASELRARVAKYLETEDRDGSFSENIWISYINARDEIQNNLISADILERDPIFIMAHQHHKSGIVVDKEQLTSEYISLISKDGQWGGDLELFVIQRIFNTAINIYKDGYAKVTQLYGGLGGPETPYAALYLYYAYGHYNLLLEDVSQASEPTPATVPVVTNYEKPMAIQLDLSVQPRITFIDDSSILSTGLNMVDALKAKRVSLSNKAQYYLKSFFVKNYTPESLDLSQIIPEICERNSITELSLNNDSILRDYSYFRTRIAGVRESQPIIKVKITNRVYQTIYECFCVINASALKQAPVLTKIEKQKLARSYYNLAKEFFEYLTLSSEASCSVKDMEIIFNLLDQSINYALTKSRLLIKEIPELATKCRTEIKINKALNSHNAPADLIVINLYLLTIQNQSNIEGQFQLHSLLALSKVYKEIGFQQISALYLEMAFGLFKKRISTLEFDKETKANTIMNAGDSAPAFSETPPKLDLLAAQASVTSMSSVIAPATGNLEGMQAVGIELNIIHDFRKILDKAYGHKQTAVLCAREKGLVSEFNQIHGHKSYEDIIKTLVLVIFADESQQRYKELSKAFPVSRYKDPFDLRLAITENVHSFLLDLLYSRKIILNQFEECKNQISDAISSYEHLSGTNGQNLYAGCNAAGFFKENHDSSNLEQRISKIKSFMLYNVELNILDRENYDSFCESLCNSKINHQSYILTFCKVIKDLIYFSACPYTLVEDRSTLSKHTIDITMDSGAMSKIKHLLMSKYTASQLKNFAIHILSTRTLYFDCNFEEDYWRGVSISIIAPNHVMNTKDKIFRLDVSGQPVTDSRVIDATISKNATIMGGSGEHGKHGLNGINGNSGGNINITCRTVDGDYNVKAEGSSGSRGGDASDGGKGLGGKPGINGQEYYLSAIATGSEKYHENGSIFGSKTYVHMDQKHISRDTSEENSLWRRKFNAVLCLVSGTDGQKGGVGGNGGNGGASGLGGTGGIVRFLEVTGGNHFQNKYSDGAPTRNGRVGKAGASGLNGINGMGYGKWYPRKPIFSLFSSVQPEYIEFKGQFTSSYFPGDYATGFAGAFLNTIDKPETIRPENDRHYTSSFGKEQSLKIMQAPKEGVQLNNTSAASVAQEITVEAGYNKLLKFINTHYLLHDAETADFLKSLADRLGVDCDLDFTGSVAQSINEQYDSLSKALKLSRESTREEILRQKEEQIVNEHKLGYQKEHQTKKSVTLNGKQILTSNERIALLEHTVLDEEVFANLANLMKQYRDLKSPELRTLLNIILEMNKVDVLNRLIYITSSGVYCALLSNLASRLIAALTLNERDFSAELLLFLRTQSNHKYSKDGAAILEKLKLFIEIDSFRHLMLSSSNRQLTDQFKVKYLAYVEKLKNIQERDIVESISLLRSEMLQQRLLHDAVLPDFLVVELRKYCNSVKINAQQAIDDLAAMQDALMNSPSKERIISTFDLVLALMKSRDAKNNLLLLGAVNTTHFQAICRSFSGFLQYLINLASAVDNNLAVSEHRILDELEMHFWDFKDSKSAPFSMYDLLVLKALNPGNDLLSGAQWSLNPDFPEQELNAAMQSVLNYYAHQNTLSSNNTFASGNITLVPLIPIYKYIGVYKNNTPEQVYDFIYECLMRFIEGNDLTEELDEASIGNLESLRAAVISQNVSLFTKAKNVASIVVGKNPPSTVVANLITSIIRYNSLVCVAPQQQNYIEEVFEVLRQIDIAVEQYIVPIYLHNEAKRQNKDKFIVKISKKTYTATKKALKDAAAAVVEFLTDENINLIDQEFTRINDTLINLRSDAYSLYLPKHQLAEYISQISLRIDSYKPLKSDSKLPRLFSPMIDHLQSLKSEFDKLKRINDDFEKASEEISLTNIAPTLQDRLNFDVSNLLATYKTHEPAKSLRGEMLEFYNYMIHKLVSGVALYLEIALNENNVLALSANGQKFTSADIVVLLINTVSGAIESHDKISIYDTAAINNLSATMHLPTQDHIVAYFGRPGHCPKELQKYFGIPANAQGEFNDKTLILTHPSSKMPFYISDKPAIVKIKNGITMEIHSKAEDSIGFSLEKLNQVFTKATELQPSLDILLPSISTHKLFKANSEVNEHSKVVVATRSDRHTVLKEIIVNLDELRATGHPAICKAVFEIQKNVVRIIEDLPKEKGYKTLLALNMFAASVKSKLAEGANLAEIGKVLMVFANNDDMFIDTNAIKASGSVLSLVYIGRFIDCYMNIATGIDPRAINELQRTLQNISPDALQVFYNKFIQELYNPLQSLASAPDIAQLEIHERTIKNVVKALGGIRANEDALVKLLNTEFNNWGSLLNQLNFEQQVTEWHDLKSFENGKLQYLLNRIRLNLGDNRYSQFISFVHSLRSKLSGQDIRCVEKLLVEAAFGNISFEKIVEVVERFEPDSWDAQAERLYMEYDPNEKSVTDIISSIRLQVKPEEHQKLDEIQDIASLIMKRLESHKNPVNVPTMPQINEFMAQLYAYKTTAQKTAWLHEKNEDGEPNIARFVEYIAFAWFKIDPDHKVPRATQIVSLLLSLNADNRGLLQQIKTGQGKTIIVGILAAAKSLLGYKVDVVSSNSDLAKKGQDVCAEFYKALNLQSANNIGSEVNFEIYKRNIVYGDASSFEGHVCRNRTSDTSLFYGRYSDPENPCCLIVDEVDSLSLDKASEMLRITHNHSAFKHLDLLLTHISSCVIRILDSSGVSLAAFAKNRKLYIEEIKKKTLINGEFPPEFKIPSYMVQLCKNKLDIYIENAIEARLMLDKDNFIVSGDKIVVMDKATGMESYSTQYSEGLQQALQIGHQLEIDPLGLESNFISNKVFFQSYGSQIFGLTGTLGLDKSRDFLRSTYGVDMLDLPTHKEVRFKRIPSIVCTYEKWAEQVVSETLKINEEQPVLIICENVVAAEAIEKALRAQLGEKLKEKNVLMYKSDQDEIEENLKKTLGAKPHDIIIATNKGGRGTDILVNLEKAKKGLHVILSYMPENARIEMQAFGRAARNGEPGTGNFVIPVEKPSDEPFDLQIEQIILKRETFDQKRITEHEKHSIPQNDIKEQLAKEYRSRVAQLIIRLKNLGVDGSLIAAYDKILCNKFAFWLEDVNHLIKEVDLYSVEKHAEVFRLFNLNFIDPVLKHANNITKDHIPDGLFGTPEDAIILGEVYLKLQLYPKALATYLKAIQLGDVTGYAERACAFACAKLDGSVSPANKKLIRRHVKAAAKQNTAFADTLKTTVGYLDFIGNLLVKRETNGFKPSGANLQIDAIAHRLDILDLHAQQLTKIIGATIDPELQNEVFGSKLDKEGQEVLIQKMYAEKMFSSNYIRKFWVAQKNRPQLLAIFKPFADHANVDLMLELFTTKNLGVDISSIPAFSQALYTQDEIWDLIRNLSSGSSSDSVKHCLKLNPEAKLPEITEEGFDEKLEALEVKIQQDQSVKSSGVIISNNILYKALKDDPEFLALLIKYQILIETEIMDLSPEALQKFESIDWGKYRELKIIDSVLGCVSVPDCVKKYIVDAKDRTTFINCIFKCEMPFRPKAFQAKFMLDMMNNLGILKSGTLNQFKYELNSKKIKSELKAKITDNELHLELLCKLITRMQGNIRVADNLISASFVLYKDLFPADTSNPDLEYFQDMLLHQFLSISNKPSPWNWNIAGLVAIALAQAIAGILLIIFCPGAGVIFGEALIDLALQDLYYAYCSYKTGNLNWNDWAKQKVLATLLTVGASMIGGFGVPVNPRGAEVLFATIKKIVQRKVMSYIVEEVTNAVLDEFADTVVDNIVDKVAGDMVRNIEKETQETLSQVHYVWSKRSQEIYSERAEFVKEHIGKRIDLMEQSNKNDAGMTESISSAAQSTGMLLAEWTSTSDNATVKGVGAFIKTATAVTKVASCFHKTAQFGSMQTEVRSETKKVLTTELKVSIPYKDERAAREHKHESNAVIDADSRAVKSNVETALKSHLHDMLATTVKTAIGTNVMQVYKQEQQFKRQRNVANIRANKKAVDLSYTVSGSKAAPIEEENLTISDSKLGKPDLYKVLTSAPVVALPVRFSQTSPAIKAGVLRYSDNLAKDPHCFFELQIVANYSNAVFCIYTPQRKIGSYIYPKTVALKRTDFTINLMKNSDPVTKEESYVLVDTSGRLYTGKPASIREVPHPGYIQKDKTLLFSALKVIEGVSTPNEVAIDDYRAKLIEFDLHTLKMVT